MPRGGSTAGQLKIGWTKTEASRLMLVTTSSLEGTRKEIASEFHRLFPDAYINLTVSEHGSTRPAVADDITSKRINGRKDTLNRNGANGTKSYGEHPLDRPNKRVFVGEAQRIIRDSLPVTPDEVRKRAEACVVSKPAKRRYEIPKSVKILHLKIVHTRGAGLCPCCREEMITFDGKNPVNAECDHFEDAYKNKVEQTWYTCFGCHKQMTYGARTDAQRAAFSAYQKEVTIYKRGLVKVTTE
jgi:hypothetical protein